MWNFQEKGSVACPNCGEWVFVKAASCSKCNHTHPGYFGFHRLVQKLNAEVFFKIIAYSCGLLFLLSLLLDWEGIGYSLNFNFLSPTNKSLAFMGAGGAWSVFEYKSWWSVLTSPFLHGSFFHLAFNLVWVNQMALWMDKYYGFAKTVIIYVLAGIAGALATALAGKYFSGVFVGAKFSIGASGSVFGMFGAIAALGVQSGSRELKSLGLKYAVVGFFLGLLMPNTDNWGHFGGFVGGYLLSYLPSLNYKKTQNIYHLLFAILLLFFTIVAFGASFQKGLILKTLY